MEKNKRKSDKLKGMEYWKKWCGSPATHKEENLGPTSSLHADNKVVMTSEPSTSFAASNIETESVVSQAPCFMPTTAATLSSHSSKLDVGFYATEDHIGNDYLKAQILKEP